MRDGVLGVGIFGLEDMISLEDGKKLIGGIKIAVEGMLDDM